jgi:type I restriction enzyme, S subunit
VKVRTVPLGEVADIANGKTPSKAQQRSTGHPVLKIRDVDELGQFRGAFESFVDPGFVRRYRGKTVESGDTLVLNAAHNADYVASKMFFAEPDTIGALATGEWLIIRPRADELDPRFASYWIRSDEARFRLKLLVKGIHLYPKDVARILCPLPPIEEQRRIAAVLDAADELRAKRREALAKLDTLTQAIFIDMFGDPAANPRRWPTIPLGRLALKFSDGPFGSNLKSDHYQDSGVRVVRLQNIGNGEFVDDVAAYISDDHFATLAKHECRPGDVLVATMGDPNLRACIQPDWLDVALNKADCVQIRVDPTSATSPWLCALLNHPSTEDMAQSLVRGQTRSRISMGRLRELSVPAPPLELQLEFGYRHAATVSQTQRCHDSSTSLDRLFASLQQRAFRGEL